MSKEVNGDEDGVGGGDGEVNGVEVVLKCMVRAGSKWYSGRITVRVEDVGSASLGVGGEGRERERMEGR